MISDGENAPQKTIAPVRFGIGKVLGIDVELRVAIHVEHTLIGAAKHGGDVPASPPIMSIDSVEAALRHGEAEITDQPLRHPVWLEPRQGRIFRACLRAFHPFDPSDADVLILRGVISNKSLLEESC